MFFFNLIILYKELILYFSIFGFLTGFILYKKGFLLNNIIIFSGVSLININSYFKLYFR